MIFTNSKPDFFKDFEKIFHIYNKINNFKMNENENENENENVGSSPHFGRWWAHSPVCRWDGTSDRAARLLDAGTTDSHKLQEICLKTPISYGGQSKPKPDHCSYHDWLTGEVGHIYITGDKECFRSYWVNSTGGRDDTWEPYKCLANNKRLWRSHMHSKFDLQDRPQVEAACTRTPFTIGGKTYPGATNCYLQNWTTDHGLATYVTGEISLPDDTCGTSGEYWGTWKHPALDFKCEDGKMRYKARLWGIPSGKDENAACNNMKVDIPELKFKAGDVKEAGGYCTNEGIFGEWGTVYIPGDKWWCSASESKAKKTAIYIGLGVLGLIIFLILFWIMRKIYRALKGGAKVIAANPELLA